jgi:superfamily II DNA or RNA helicase
MQAKKFRPYQQEASAAITKAWSDKRSCIAVVATGGGKTLIAAGTAARIQNQGKILFLANRNELCTQPLAAFSDQLGYEPALEKAESIAPLDAQVVVASVQTLSRQKRLDRFPRDHFSFVFADECHMSVADSWKRIFNHFGAAKICGITATPFRSDAKKLTDIFECEAYRKDLFDLVDEGYLVDPDHVDRLSTAISLAQVRVKQSVDGKDYDLNDAADAIAPYFDAIAKELAEKHASKHILAFLPLVASSQKFVRACQAAGINAIHVDGEDPDRDAKLQAFKDGNIQLLSNSNLLHTGVDMPKCDCTLNLRPTKSKVLYAQIIGRSTRTVPGLIDGLDTVEARKRAIAASSKPRAYIIDPLWLSEDHDLVTPAFMIADDEEFAVEMNKAAGKSYSLRQIRDQIQLSREEVIRRRLEATVRFREGRISPEYFAASIHDHALVNYEAIYLWEKRKPSPFQLRLLAQAGIDTTTVTTSGYATKLMQAVGRRRYKRLPEITQLAPLAESRGINDPTIWTATQRDLDRINAELALAGEQR